MGASQRATALRDRPAWAARLLCAVAAVIAAFLPQTALAQGVPVKIAFVIANSAYLGDDWPPLKNPAADARLLKASLEQAGFRVMRPAVNLQKTQLLQRIEEFRAEVAAVPENSIALIYFSGHGLQVEGQNYLVPVGARSPMMVDQAQGAAREKILTGEFVSLNFLLGVFGQLRRELPSMANILILDACRVNPLDGKTRSAGRAKGLADVSPVSNSLIAFAAEPGNVAYDGDGENSPFALSLAAEFKEKSLPLNLLFARARVRTMELTGNDQRPIYQDALSGMFCLETCDIQRASAIPRPPERAVGIARSAGASTSAGMPCAICPQLVAVKGAKAKLEISRLPVSNRQWRQCVEESSCAPIGDKDVADDLPVTGVSWVAARDFAAWLADRTGQRWRLPMADEWRAALAPVRQAPRRALRRLPAMTQAAPPADGPGYVGQVLEWTGSCPKGNEPCGDRVAMGATFDDDYSDLFEEHALPATGTGQALGFRVVREQ